MSAQIGAMRKDVPGKYPLSDIVATCSPRMMRPIWRIPFSSHGVRGAIAEMDAIACITTHAMTEIHAAQSHQRSGPASFCGGSEFRRRLRGRSRTANVDTEGVPFGGETEVTGAGVRPGP